MASLDDIVISTKTNQDDLSCSNDESSDEYSSSSDEESDNQDEPLVLGQGWAVYTDENSGHPYYYNNNTGISQWEPPNLGGRSAAAVQPLVHLLQQRVTKTQTRSFDASSSDEDSEDLSGDESEESNDDTSDGEVDDPDFISSQSDVESAVRFYVLSSLFHVIFIEAPLASLEGIFRGGFYTFVGMVSLFLATIKRQNDSSILRTKAIVHSGLQMLTAGFLLLIPGFLLFAYKDMIDAWKQGRLAKSAKVDDWAMGSIPSPLGQVDARQFMSITRGQGAYATNVRNLRSTL